MSDEDTKIADTRLDRMELTLQTHANLMGKMQTSIDDVRKEVAAHNSNLATQFGAVQQLIPVPLRGPVGQWIVAILVLLSLVGNTAQGTGIISHFLK